jgi:signal transduction histidine kinase
VARLTAALTRTQSARDIYALAMDALKRALQVDRAAILLFDQAGVMRFEAWDGLSAAYRRATTGHCPWQADTDNPEPVLVADAAAEPSLQGLAVVIAAEGIRAMAFIPLVLDGRLLGKFMLYFDRPHDFGEAEVGMARTIADHVAVALERQRAEKEREALLVRERDARGKAEAAIHLRDEFLSVASHELRTPLATLKGHAQLALRQLDRSGQLTPERAAEALRAIARQSEKLNWLMGQLLDISRLEAGKLALERQPTNLVALVEQVVAGARARGAGHVITLTAPRSLESEVDPLRIEQVVTNLLDNAIKYSPEGGPIDVAVSHSADGESEISVRDRGLGIPTEMRGRIFERFYQAHGDAYRSGMGLGLYISSQIIELHRGEITADFPSDGGSRFVVRLPLTPEMARPARL